MDHEAAAKTQAIERYLLGEMPAPERDAFEEHYFTCHECAEGIRAGSELTGDMKVVLRDFRRRPVRERRSWFSWPVLAGAYAAAMTAVLVYQNVAVLPVLKAPRSMAAAVILDGRTRGDAPVLHAGDPLRFLIAAEGAEAPHLYVELDNASGAALRSGDVETPKQNNPLDVYFPGALDAGRYELVVRDQKGGREVSRSSFAVVR